MNLTIRAVRIEDIEQISLIKSMKGVRENTLGLLSNRISRMEKRISNLSNNEHFLVAEMEENDSKKIVGLLMLVVNTNPRTRHSGSVGIMIHTDYQRKGIGRALFNKLIDLADNWLMLIRLELEVFVDNEKAINLYKSLGFEIEGRKKYAAIKNGKYEDQYLMARYNI